MSIKLNEQIKTTEKDIVVYKLLYVPNKGTIKALFNTYEYHLNKLNEELRFLNETIKNLNNKKGCIDIGFHSFVKKKDAFKFRKGFNFGEYSSLKVYKCIIPKGSKYIEGEYIDTTVHKVFKNIVSDKIIIIKKVNKFF